MKIKSSIYRPRFEDILKRLPELVLLGLAFIGIHSIDTGPQVFIVQDITAYGTLLWPLAVLYIILSHVPIFNRVTLSDHSITISMLGIFRKTLLTRNLESVVASKVQNVDIVGIRLKSTPSPLQFSRKLRRHFIGWDEMIPNMYKADGSKLIDDVPGRLNKLGSDTTSNAAHLKSTTSLQQFTRNPLAWFRVTRKRKIIGIAIASLIVLQIAASLLFAPWQTTAFKRANPEVFKIQASLERQYPNKQIGVLAQTYYKVDNDADGKKHVLVIVTSGTEHLGVADARKIEAIACPVLFGTGDKYDRIILQSTAEKRLFLFFVRNNKSGILACPHIFLAPPEGTGQGSGIIPLEGVQAGPESWAAPADPLAVEAEAATEVIDDTPIPPGAKLECCELQQ